MVRDGRQRRFPPKQLVEALTGLDRADFNSHQARSLLVRLGFPVQRRRSAHSDATPRLRTPRWRRGACPCALRRPVGRTGRTRNPLRRRLPRRSGPLAPSTPSEGTSVARPGNARGSRILLLRTVIVRYTELPESTGSDPDPLSTSRSPMWSPSSFPVSSTPEPSTASSRDGLPRWRQSICQAQPTVASDSAVRVPPLGSRR